MFDKSLQVLGLRLNVWDTGEERAVTIGGVDRGVRFSHRYRDYATGLTPITSLQIFVYGTHLGCNRAGAPDWLKSRCASNGVTLFVWHDQRANASARLIPEEDTDDGMIDCFSCGGLFPPEELNEHRECAACRKLVAQCKVCLRWFDDERYLDSTTGECARCTQPSEVC